MKKILLCLTILCAIFLTGCGKEEEKVTLNLKDLPEKIDNLKSDEFARLDASSILSEKIEGLEEVYTTSKFDVDMDDLEEYNISINDKTKDMFVIVKPVDGKKDDVKKAFDKYVDKQKDSVKEKLAFDEIQGYLIYIISDNSKDLLEEVKECRTNIFNQLMPIEDEDLSQRFGIEKDMVDEYLIKLPTLMVNSNSYMIIKPAKGKKDAVKEKMNDYMEKLEEQWKTYLPDQYDLVKNRLEEEYGDYLIYIISKDNDAVFDVIKDSNK